MTNGKRSRIHWEIVKRLLAVASSGKLAHAYLFSGPRGGGKFDTALAVARVLNCLESDVALEDCSCMSCRKFDTENHPDLFILQCPVDKNEIVIGQIIPRSGDEYTPLLPWLSVKALEARVRVVIVKDADLLNTRTANAFLKTLEEPCPGTLFILTSSAPDIMPQTVLSRCQEVRFFPEGNSALAERLKNEYDVASLSSQVLARYSAGSVGRATDLGEDFLMRKNAIIDGFILSGDLKSALAQWGSDKDAARELSDVVLAFFHDVLLARNGALDGVFYNIDRASQVREVAARMAVDQVDAVIKQAICARAAAGDNFNIKLALSLLKALI